jgi:hypothetical protein
MKAAMLVMSIAFVTNVGVSSAGPLPAPAVSVRTYNYAAVPAATLLAGRSEADQIFRSAGIPLVWIDCRVPGSEDGRACIEPLLPGRDLILRLVDRMPAGDARLVALGESMLDREARAGVLMTIDMFPIRAVAERASSPVATLLGRAFAHEIGHLLLGSGGHPRMGLMRALWSQEELRGLRPAHWGFSPREAARMRQKLLVKSRTAD